MAANHRPDLGFERDSIVVHHGVFALLVDTLNKQIQVKYQSMPISPYDTHKRVMSAFLAALFIYATASVAEAIPRSQESVYQRLFGNIRLFASALATVFLLVLLTPPWGYSIISILWICLLVSLAYESCQQFYQLLSQAYTDMLEKLFDGERSREEDPSESAESAALYKISRRINIVLNDCLRFTCFRPPILFTCILRL